MFNKKNIVLFFLLLGGIIIGAMLASVCSTIPFLSWLSFGKTIGLGLSSPMVLDLSVLKLSFGFEVGINVAQILCIVLSIMLYRWLVKKL